MCGICGVFFCDPDHHIDADTLADMNRRIAHRGPDDEGFFVDKNVGLAMRRLSIIDVSTGHQPIANETRDVWIVFNGEVYNHCDLRHELEAKGHRYSTRSDTETILHLYEEYGAACVKRLRGMFAFVIWDSRTRVLFAARDRLGIKPLYYRWDGKAFLFASEIKAILACPEVKPEFNRAMLAEYLAFGYLTGPDTMFSGIQKLAPGHTLEVTEEAGLHVDCYWDLPLEVDPEPRSREYYVSRYRELLENAVNSHLMSDVPLGMFLSGGLDSSAIAALASKIRGEQIKTFSVGYGSAGAKEEAFSELAYAREVAKHIRSDHHEICLSREEFFAHLPQLIWHEDEPIVWPSSLSLFTVAQLARNYVTVVLTGEGSDETLAGYTRYAWTLMNARMDATYRALTTSGIRRAVAKALEAGPVGATLHRKLRHTFLMRDGNSWPSFYYDNFFSAFSESDQTDLLTSEALVAAGNAYAGSMSAWERGRGDLLHRMLYADIHSYLTELLMKQDQMSMAASIESRVPFLDHELVEFAIKIPQQCSVRGLAGKYILKQAMDGVLPGSVIYRKKMGFPTPWEHWLTGATLDSLERMLLEPRSMDRRVFRPQAVQQIFAEQRNRTRDHSNRIWRLLNFEVWQRIFLDGQSPEQIRWD